MTLGFAALLFIYLFIHSMNIFGHSMPGPVFRWRSEQMIQCDMICQDGGQGRGPGDPERTQIGCGLQDRIPGGGIVCAVQLELHFKGQVGVFLAEKRAKASSAQGAVCDVWGAWRERWLRKRLRANRDIMVRF